MLPDEKDRLLSLFDDESRWCQEAEARDATGEAVHFDSEAAVAWDVVGAVCHLFGWKRALELFGQISRHVLGRYRNVARTASAISAMSALVDFNDDPQLEHGTLMTKLQDLPVSSRRSSIQDPLGTYRVS